MAEKQLRLLHFAFLAAAIGALMRVPPDFVAATGQSSVSFLEIGRLRHPNLTLIHFEMNNIRDQNMACNHLTASLFVATMNERTLDNRFFKTVALGECAGMTSLFGSSFPWVVLVAWLRLLEPFSRHGHDSLVEF